MKRDVATQFALFIVVGLAAAIGHYGVLILLVEGLGMPPVPASATGYLVGGAISYHLNYGRVFASRQAHLPTVAKFVAVAAVGLGFNSAIMWALAESLGLHYLLSQVMATGTVMVWSFAANRSWTFGGPQP